MGQQQRRHGDGRRHPGQRHQVGRRAVQLAHQLGGEQGQRQIVLGTGVQLLAIQLLEELVTDLHRLVAIVKGHAGHPLRVASGCNATSYAHRLAHCQPHGLAHCSLLDQAIHRRTVVRNLSLGRCPIRAGAAGAAGAFGLFAQAEQRHLRHQRLQGIASTTTDAAHQAEQLATQIAGGQHQLLEAASQTAEQRAELTAPLEQAAGTEDSAGHILEGVDGISSQAFGVTQRITEHAIGISDSVGNQPGRFVEHCHRVVGHLAGPANHLELVQELA
ncbi:hypothetical protein D3C78_1247930 [compost metagenome]